MSLRVVGVILLSDVVFTDCFWGAGLDAYNAFNPVDSLISLARDYNHTVIFTIHQ
jgi:hypothetical protein